MPIPCDEVIRAPVMFAVALCTNIPRSLKLSGSGPVAFMYPQYSIGDYVCGKPISVEYIHQANNKIIIAELSSEVLLVRKLMINANDNTIALTAINPQFSDSIMVNADISQWAPILCHLRYEPLYD